MHQVVRTVVAGALLSWSVLGGAAQLNSEDFDLYPADFDGNGKTDLLYIGKRPDLPSGIALANASTGVPEMGFQSWHANYLGIPWSNGTYKAVIGDYNGDGKSDVLLQRQTAGNSYVLLANTNAALGSVGQILGISQTLAQTTLGIAWSADQHRLVAGDFDGDDKTDLFFQATSDAGTNAVVLAHTGGGLFTRTTSNCWAGGPQQCWSDSTGSHYGFAKWNTQAAYVHAGDFNGDGKTDLLVQPRPKIVMIDYDIPIPVPTFTADSFGISLAGAIDGAGTIFRSANQFWDWNELGANWSPLNSNLVIGDFNGDGKDDILVQSRSAGRANVLVQANTGGTGQLQTATALASNIANLSGSSYQLMAGRFGNSSSSVLYAQATTASGTNFYTANITGGTVSTYSSTLQLVASTPTLPATGVGATAGTAGVTATGTASYTIPLQLPRGTADMTPQLALQYQHSGKNGYLGVGWGLSGLSIITRCPKTHAQDGETQGVLLTSADQYCLDGNRLRKTSGTQGADGSLYRTELETYSRITAKGGGATGPDWWQVEMRDGRIYEYGNSTDSRIPVTGTTTTRVWALSKIKDRASNYISFAYINDTVNGSYRPDKITYAGHETPTAVTPPYTVQFTWQARNPNERVVHYYAGGLVEETKRASLIEVKHGTTVIRKYIVNYSTAEMSRITSVQECGSTQCLPATTFSWSDIQTSGSLPVYSTAETRDEGFAPPGWAFSQPPRSVDLNNDGLPDAVVDTTIAGVYSGPFMVYWGVRPGQTPAAPTVMSEGGLTLSGISDFDLDGKDDILYSAGGKWLHYKPDGTLAIDDTATSLPWSQTQLIDVDGDGYQDLVYVLPSDLTHVYVRFHNRDGSAGFESTASTAWTTPSGTTITSSTYPWWMNVSSTRAQITSADVNGDGRQDIFVHVQDGWRVLYSNGTGFDMGELLVTISNGTDYMPPTVIDVNGDGCTDVVYKGPTGAATWRLRTSKCRMTGGSGLNGEVNTGIDASVVNFSSSIHVVDWNMDGYQDLIFPTAGGSPGTTSVAISSGALFYLPVAVGNGRTAWADRTGDGLPDKVDNCVSACGGSQYTTGMSYWAMMGPKPNMLLSATDGFGNKSEFTYAPLTDTSVYTRGSGATGATQDFNGSMYVVKQLKKADGVSGNYALDYRYEQARRNVKGRGFLGFGKRIVTDNRTGIVTEETYNQAIAADGTGWEKAGRLAETKVRQSASGPTIQRVVNTWLSITPTGNPNGRYPYVSQSVTEKYELDDTQFSTITTQTAIDGYGTPYDVTRTVVENATGLNATSSATFRTFTPTANVVNNTANWCLNRRTRIQDIRSHSLTDGGSITRTVDQAWNYPYCRMTSQTVEPGSSWVLTTALEYDDFNNVKKSTVSGTGISPNRVTETYWGTTGQFPEWIKNPKLHQTSFTWDAVRGLKEAETDPNGNVTAWDYDDFWRVSRIMRPDGTATRQDYYACNSGNAYCSDSLLRYMVKTSERNTADGEVTYRNVYYDSLGRPKYEQQLGFGGALSVVQTMYDARGNVASQSVPYYAGTSAYAGTSYEYDLLNRVTKTQRPVSDTDQSLLSESTDYDGLTVTRTNPDGFSQVQVSNAWGQVVRATDEAGEHTTYTYNAFGDLRTVKDPLNNQTSISYNIRGFKQSSSDPDLGTWAYTYDATGAVLLQTDAKSQVTEFQYDELGRVKVRKDHPRNAADTTTFTFDTATKGIGQLHTVTAPGSYSETYAYDSKSRRSSLTTLANGTNYTFSYAYDASLGTVSSMTYPASTGTALTVQYAYQNGYLKDIRDSASPSTPIWQVVAQDSRGNVIQETFGNGQQSYVNFDETSGQLNYLQTGPGGGSATQNLTYHWDKVGNLTRRQDLSQGLTEVFGYDSLNRLTSTQRNSDPVATMTYDEIGNLTSKTGVGTYTYPASGATSVRPHAVTSAGSSAYTYDANGNMVTRTGATVEWSTFNYPLTINQTGGNYSTFYYGADRNRYRQTVKDGSVTEDRITIAGLYEKLTRGADTEYRHFVQAGGKVVAVVKRSSTTGNEKYYLHDDHLGSTDVITNQAGAVVVRLSFDAWGNRRGSNWTGNPTAADKTAISASTHRGFTGHEQLDNLNLVHMNGRVYDPVIARFMSADPIVQAPYRSQSFNRYSYVWNNPLNATDPTGFSGERATGASPEIANPPLEEIVVTATRATDAAHRSAQMDPVSIGRDLQQTQQMHSQMQMQQGSSWMAGAHMALTGMSIGMDATGVGAAFSWIPNLLDGALSAAEGDWQGAGLSVAGAIPFVGVAADAAKIAKATKSLDKAGDVAKSGSRRPGDFTRGEKRAAKTENATQNGGRMSCKDCSAPLENIASKKGVPTPSNQAHVHHEPPIHSGGGRHSKAVVLCPECHKRRHASGD